jgi:RsiW-degrading membrane proteinase PrsW (M82 family)
VILGWAVTTVFLVVIAAIVILIVFYQSLAHGPSSPN